MCTVLSHQAFHRPLGLGTTCLNEQAEIDYPTEKRRCVFVLPGWNGKLHTFKIVTLLASKIIPGATDRIKVTRFLSLSLSHTHRHTQTHTDTHTHTHTHKPFLELCGMARFQLCLKWGPGLRRQCAHRPPCLAWLPQDTEPHLAPGCWAPTVSLQPDPSACPQSPFSTTPPAL